jgi:hypothetical protein
VLLELPEIGLSIALGSPASASVVEGNARNFITTITEMRFSRSVGAREEKQA